MSGYQSYEFQAIDCPLSPEDQEYVQSLSSRVKLTATNAQFIYHYSDFRGEPEALVDRCFDLYVHVSSYGVRQLIIRLPKELANPKIFAPYLVKYMVSMEITEKSILLNINVAQEDYARWLHETSYVEDLLPLREELLRGDLRLLYLAWLAAGFAVDAMAIENLVEPPIPANLKTLSPGLLAFTDLFEIGENLIAAAAIESPVTQVEDEPIADWIAALPEVDRNAYLLRVVQGESHVGAEIIQRLRKKSGTKSKAKLKSPGRTLAQMCAIADQQ
jgi:hypothetical protein